MSDRDFARILIIKPSSFGDVIHALPVLNGLRERWPSAKISWLVSTACAGLLEGHRALDEIIPFDRRRYGLMARNVRITVEFMAFVNALRARAFDLVLDLQGLFRSGFLALASGAPVRLGFASAREFGWMFYSHRVAAGARDTHAVDRNYAFAGRLGFADVPIRFDLPVSASARAQIHERLSGRGLEPGSPYVLMSPGTRWETKRWPAESFAAVARRIERDCGLPVVLIGTSAETPIARRVADLADGSVVNLAGTTDLPALAALVADATAVVMNDSGPMHLATAFGKPMVAIYGPTNPVRTGPYRRTDAVARLDLPCSPCYLRHVAQCPHGHRCMRDLSPEVVADRVVRLLAALVGAT